MADDAETPVKLGNRLKTMRLAKGMSITELADEANLSKAYVSQLEAGHQANPSLEVLKKISTALEITVGRLIGGEGVRAIQTARGVEDPGLEAFLEERRRTGNPLPERDVQLLLNLQWRGGRVARSLDDWAFIYAVIRRTWDKTGRDDD